MVEFKGGRGKEAPYKTSLVRVIDDVKPQIEAINSTCRELKLLRKEEELQKFISRIETAIISTAYKTSTNLPSLEEAKKIANKLLKQKQSKEKTIEKLLQVLYNQE